MSGVGVRDSIAVGVVQAVAIVDVVEVLPSIRA